MAKRATKQDATCLDKKTLQVVLLEQKPKLGSIELHRVLGRPLSSGAIVPSPVGLEKLRNVRNQWIVRVRVSQQGANAKQNLANRQCWAPLVFQNVKTNTAVRVDVAVINTRGKVNLRRLKSTESRKRKTS